MRSLATLTAVCGAAVPMAACIVVLPLCGCKRPPDPPPPDALNAPLSREEAASLMQAVDADGAAGGWDTDVAREIRRRMTGRLLAAGMTQEEIDTWIASPLTAGKSTKRGEHNP